METHTNGRITVGLGAARAGCLLMMATLLIAAIPGAAAAAPAPNYHLLKKVVLGGEGTWDYLICDSAARRGAFTSRGAVT